MQHQDYMRRAIALAEKGLGFTAPNPMVGAVIVKDGRIIGEGYHTCCGKPHAEREALAACTEPPVGATMYVTLEPCCHQGRQPPCTEAVMQAGIREIYIGSADPNPLVAGKGVQLLRQAGLTVHEGFLREECDRLNPVFFHYIKTRRPYVALKYAMTLDGKIAAYTGASQWVTGEEARSHVQTLRHRYTGILVGVGTVLADDPLLTCRMEGGKNPVRIVCDSRLRTPLTSRLVQTAAQVPTILATCCTNQNAIVPYEELGCQVLSLPAENKKVDLSLLLAALGEQQIDSILVEGGGSINWSFLEKGLVNKVYTYLAPKLFGGKTAKTPVEGLGFPTPAEAVQLRGCTLQSLGRDFLIESEVEPRVYRNH